MSSGALVSGCLFALGLDLGFFTLGIAVQRRLTPGGGATDALLDAFLFATAIAVAAVELLGFGGQLTIGKLALLVAAGNAVVFRAHGRSIIQRLRVLVRAAWTGLRASPFVAALLAFGGLLACRALACVPLAWDALSYHLTYVAVWIRERAFVPFQAGGVWEQYESFPKAGEALFFLAMAPLRNDALVGLVNLPFWLGIALAVRSAARPLGASARHAELWLLPLALHPVLAAYVTPAYVEVQMTFYLLAAVACGLRALEDERACAPFCAALGLAIGTKITALSWLMLAVLFALLMIRAHGPSRALRAFAGMGTGLGLVVAVPFYLSNLARCGNPVYPAALPFASEGPAAGSLALKWTLESASIIGLNAFGQLFDVLTTSPLRVRYPLGPGPLALWLGLAAPVQALCARDKTQRARALALFALSGFMLAVYFLSPHNGHYLEANTRFLGSVCALCVLSLVASHASAPTLLRLALACGAYAITLLALIPTTLWRMPSWAPPAEYPGTWASAFVFLSLLGFALAWPRRASAKAARPALVLGALSLALPFAVVASLGERERDRTSDLVHGVELHPIPVDRALWPRVIQLPPGRLAFAVGGYHSWEGWFFYPFFGARLDRSVEYVDIEREAGPACQRRGRLRDKPDYDAWSARLEERGIKYLFTTGDPLEAKWARAHPARFRLRSELGTDALFDVKDER